MFRRFGKPATPTIRRLGPEAARDCARIHARGFLHPWNAEEFESLIAGRDAFAHGARAGGLRRGLIGFVISRRAAEEAEILTIAVLPALRGRGIGAALLATHLPALAATGVKTLFLEVEAGNTAALRLYHSFGFAQVGERQAYYRTADGSRSKALVFRRDFD